MDVVKCVTPLGTGHVDSKRFHPMSLLIDVYANEGLCMLGNDYCKGIGPASAFDILLEDGPINIVDPICPYCLSQEEILQDADLDENGYRLVRRYLINPFIGFTKQLEKLDLKPYHITDYVITRLPYTDFHEIITDCFMNGRFLEEFSVSEEYVELTKEVLDYRPRIHIPSGQHDVFNDAIQMMFSMYCSPYRIQEENEMMKNMTPDDPEYRSILNNRISRLPRIVKEGKDEVLQLRFSKNESRELDVYEYDVFSKNNRIFSFSEAEDENGELPFIDWCVFKELQITKSHSRNMK